ncbi:hypothetical protein ACFW81_07170 [Streptomyces angustmyceticus]|uniref:hypothetical protein n=1 Tax=Streptomyces angustmyceticus TaxID=285578 RepID=UPI0036831D91
MPSQITMAVRVQRAVEDLGHQADQLLAVGDRPERQPWVRGGERCARGPLEAQALHEGPGSLALDQCDQGVDARPCRRVLPPVAGDEPYVLRRLGALGDDGGQRRPQQSAARGPVAFRAVEDVEEEGLLVAASAPPAGPGHGPSLVQGDPEPLGAAATGAEVVGDLVVEGVGELVEEFDLVRAGDRTDRRVEGVLRCCCGQDALLEDGARAAPGQRFRSAREGRRTTDLRFIGVPSFRARCVP